ncbi:MAG: NAD(P)-binding domain-containing protein [Xanthobacteraceae bacterium]
MSEKRGTAKASRIDDCEVAVIGAGPYGLAAAAHLRGAGVCTVVFGDAMSFWRQNMPKGMRLRSAWHASHIDDPDHALSLDIYAQERRLEPRHNLPLEEFVRYGDWFQGRAVPDLDPRKAARIERLERGFRIRLEDGDHVNAGRVIVATGLANQDFRPAAFAGTPAALVSHTSEHADFARFGGQSVAVIGRGQSAAESAVLLSEAGAKVELVSRGEVRWLGSRQCAERIGGEPFWHPNKILTAPSGVGPFPLNWLNEAPGIVRRLPASVRQLTNARSTRAGAAAWLLPRAAAIRFNPGRSVVDVQASGGRITLHLDNGAETFDHVLLATGYRVDLARLGLLKGLLGAVRCVDGAPMLGAGFESSMPRLHFIGASAIASYGPLMRFIAGCGFTAREVTKLVLAKRGHSALGRRKEASESLLADTLSTQQ